MAINWGAARQGQNDLFQYFQMGQQIGQGIVDQKVNKALGNVMMGGGQAPAPQGAPQGGTPAPVGMTPGIGGPMQPQGNAMSGDLATIARYKPELIPQIQKQQQDAEAKRFELQTKQREAIRTGAVETAKLLEPVTDEASYQQARQVAARLGMNVSNIPPNYDPAWVQEQKLITRFMAEKPEALSTFGKIAADEGKQPGTPEYNARVTELVKADALKTIPLVPGGGVAGVNTMDGTARLLIAPNPGTAQTGAPVAGGPAPGTVVGGFRFKGGNPNDRNSWEPAGGQPGGNGPFAP